MFFRKFISFIFIALFAIVGAFNVPAETPPKFVKFKVKAENLTKENPVKAVSTNFVRTDALVFYENDRSVMRTAVLKLKENSPVFKCAADSQYFKRHIQHTRTLEFIYI